MDSSTVACMGVSHSPDNCDRRAQSIELLGFVMGAIRLEQVEKWFGDDQVIKGVDISINDGEFVVYVGPSGCGKSITGAQSAVIPTARKSSAIRR